MCVQEERVQNRGYGKVFGVGNQKRRPRLKLEDKVVAKCLGKWSKTNQQAWEKGPGGGPCFLCWHQVLQ